MDDKNELLIDMNDREEYERDNGRKENGIVTKGVVNTHSQHDMHDRSFHFLYGS